LRFLGFPSPNQALSMSCRDPLARKTIVCLFSSDLIHTEAAQ
jgi:hypothetical protein